MNGVHFVEERTVPPSDSVAGVVRRWAVVPRDTGTLTLVALLREDAGRYLAPPALRCSHCAYPDCRHVVLVRAEYGLPRGEAA